MIVTPEREEGSAGAPPSQDDVARRAHESWFERGREPGHALDHWLQAERELAARVRPSPRSRPSRRHRA